MSKLNARESIPKLVAAVRAWADKRAESPDTRTRSAAYGMLRVAWSADKLADLGQFDLAVQILLVAHAQNHCQECRDAIGEFLTEIPSNTRWLYQVLGLEGSGFAWSPVVNREPTVEELSEEAGIPLAPNDKILGGLLGQLRTLLATAKCNPTAQAAVQAAVDFGDKLRGLGCHSYGILMILAFAEMTAAEGVEFDGIMTRLIMNPTLRMMFVSARDEAQAADEGTIRPFPN